MEVKGRVATVAGVDKLCTHMNFRSLYVDLGRTVDSASSGVLGYREALTCLLLKFSEGRVEREFRAIIELR